MINDPREVLRSALRRGNEAPNVEFKAFVDPGDETTWFELVRTVAALTNGAIHGYVFVGVHDKTHEIMGLPDGVLAKFDQAEIHRKLSAHLTPPPRVDVLRFDEAGRQLVALVVPPFDDIPTFVSQRFKNYGPGTMLIRTDGGETAPASKEHDIRALCQRIGGRREFNEMVERLRCILEDRFKEMLNSRGGVLLWGARDAALGYRVLTPERYRTLVPPQDLRQILRYDPVIFRLRTSAFPEEIAALKLLASQRGVQLLPPCE